ncbi:hypothetical protein BACEGG_00163 [Bacteroides eggerthii DSM 20697]|nr:hypothetical protein BACEGG_00163 [Bacteroides eggerthii DSM 20697]
MGGRSASQVRNPFPVGRVVPGVHSGTAEVGYFVVLVAGIVKRVHQGGEETDTAFFVYLMDAVCLQQLVDAGTLFVGQVIGGDMFHAETDSLLQITFPPLVCFAGQSVDEVDAYVVETGTPAVMYGLDGLFCIVAAVQQLQGGIVKSLYPHADTVERQLLQHGSIFLRQIVRIGFKGDFPAVFHTVIFPDGFKDFPEIFFCKL